jgi:hypothetical protein
MNKNMTDPGTVIRPTEETAEEQEHIHDESEGSEFLDDPLRMTDQPLVIKE